MLFFDIDGFSLFQVGPDAMHHLIDSFLLFIPCHAVRPLLAIIRLFRFVVKGLVIALTDLLAPASRGQGYHTLVGGRAIRFALSAP